MLPVKSSLLPTVSRFFDDDWNSLFDWSTKNHAGPSNTLPAVNIKETAENFEVEMAIPGMKKSDFQIELTNNVLTIKCESEKKSEDVEHDNYTRREFNYQFFKRSFNLNKSVVDDAKIKATYKDGILSLNLPKREDAKEKPARLINIS